MRRIVRGIVALIAFLTVLPAPRGSRLEDAADVMHLSPLIGTMIGLIVGGAALALSNLFPALLTAAISVLLLLFITGLHHLDGLVDMADGLMKRGSASERLQAMREPYVGVGGLFAGFASVLLTVISLSYVPRLELLGSLISSETSAKLSMFALGLMGSGNIEGTGSTFIKTMKGGNVVYKILIAYFITWTISVVTVGLKGGFLVIIATLTSATLASISKRALGGVTGDVFGAANELTRLLSLLYLVAT